MFTASRRNVIIGLGAAAGIAACGTKSASGDRRLGVAVAGLGMASVDMFIPSVQRSSQCRLAALVDVDVEKMRSLGQKFGIPPEAQYTQETFDRIADNPDIDLVYVAVPNALHAEYTIRAAQAGKHVLCEKPMAVSTGECQAMIDACEKADRILAIAYRLHHSPHHRALLQSLQKQDLGQLKVLRADIGYPLGENPGWRTNRKLAGGGALLEQGVYSVNAACTMTGEIPTEISGYELKSDPALYADVDETVSWTMRFPSGAIANCVASYTMPANHIWAGSGAGWYELDMPFSTDKIQSRTSNGKVSMDQVDQFALQTEHFCELIRNNQRPGAGISPQDGMRDVRIINAIYESINTGRTITLS